MAAVFDENLKPLKFEQITPTTAQGVTLEPGAVYLLLQAESQNVRWRDDGTPPTDTVGHILTAGDPPFFYRGRPADIEFIEAAAGAVLNITQYKAGN